MNRTTTITAISTILLFGLVAAAYVWKALVNYRPPSPEVLTLTGEKVDLITYPRPVAVNFFAPWCPPCAREMPLLVQNANTYDILFVGVQDTKENILAFAQRYAIPPNRLLLGGYGGPTTYFKIRAVPTTLVFCPDTLKHLVGEITPDRLPELTCPKQKTPPENQRGQGPKTW